MKKIEKQYEQLMEKFVQWAETISDIRAAIVVGSRARIDHPADEWADLDIIVITTDPERYISTTNWLENMGNPLLTFLEPTPGDDMERRVLFAGMLDVDFAIVPKRNIQQLLQHGVPPQDQTELFNVFGRGMRILVDKDKIGSQLQKIISSIKTPTPHPPSQTEFLEVINDFLFHAVFTAKHLQRGELWWTITCLNCYMQRLLHRMIEWHAKAIQGWDYETWFRGRFLEEWADSRVLKGLQVAFAHYEVEDIKHTLLAVMDLFRLIAMETAKRLNYPYPTKADKYVTDWIGRCFSYTS
ncbi:MAG: aminoglycoside 6-adenylyltransferase [Promethearchaeota archaeon]